MDDIEETHDRGTVVGYCGTTVGVNKLVHSTRSQGGPDSLRNRHAGVDVRHDLALSLACVGALSQENDLGLECSVHIFI